MKTVYLSLVAFLVLGSGCGAREVAFADVLSKPDQYDGTLITLRGAAVVRFEGSSLCATAEEHEGEKGPPFAPRPRPCFWLESRDVSEPNALEWDELRKLDKHYVIVTGLFDMAKRGHGNCCSGAIRVRKISSTGFHGKGGIPPIPPE